MQEKIECHIFGIMLIAMNSGRGCHSQLFMMKGLGLVLAPKKYPNQSQAFEEVKNG